jgi:aspartate ammonia-lyase
MPVAAGYRIEHDLIGEREVPSDALYGIHTVRALENFPLSGRLINRRLVHAFGQVKLACARVNQRMIPWPEHVFKALSQSCEEMADGLLDEHVVVDALQGGAGTSTNMNVNEVLANRSLALLLRPAGDYQTLHPIDEVNKHQSTNDTYPTALKVAAIGGIRELDGAVVRLQEAFQRKEKEFAHVVKVGRTQLQDAALTTLGREMSAYADAIGRDRWRISKCEERLRVVNLGGTAIGTGLGAPRRFIFEVVDELRAITGYGLARAENLVDCTQNADVFVEVSGILRALASSLLKISSDLRLMSSGPEAGFGEISLPAVQAGSSIMPGKVNPVIPEAVSQAAMAVFAYDQTVVFASSSGNLELNAFLPIIADALLGSIDLLIAASKMLADKCVDGIVANEDACRRHVEGSTAVATALIRRIGYEGATGVVLRAKACASTIRRQVLTEGLMSEQEFEQLISPESVTALGDGGPA